MNDPRFFGGLILAIESSCDETSAAVVEGVSVRSNIVASQVAMHEKWGGVVPEAAARAHVEAILPVIEEALEAASVGLADVEAVAVTNRPGLVGALSVGVSAAKALAFARSIPLLGVHHLEGHLLSVLAEAPDLGFPHASLIVSGGHTELVAVHQLGRYSIIGQTLDDAAGEAFDKGARLLGLGYPGGRAIEDAAMRGDSRRYKLPQGLSGPTTDFSFSGLKTAVLRLVEREGESINVADAAASLQRAIVDVLTERALRACLAGPFETLTLVGGVAANLALRQSLAEACSKESIRFVTPRLDLCTDNAAMIGIAASYRFALGERDDWDLDTLANSPL